MCTQRFLRVLSVVYLLFAAKSAANAAEKPAPEKPGASPAVKDSLAADKKALAAFQAFVGEWKGVGQPRRGSSQGAWTEESDWAWRFADGHAELTAQLSHNPYFTSLRLQPGDELGKFRLIGTQPAEKAAKNESTYDGNLGQEGQLVLTRAGDTPANQPARITLRLVAGDRLVTLFERRSGEQFVRLAEVGNTRKGSSFAVKGGDPHECIVTGGHGTIPVEYKGETYYVCCTGCRDLFKEDPEKVLKEWRERKAQEHDAGK